MKIFIFILSSSIMMVLSNHPCVVSITQIKTTLYVKYYMHINQSYCLIDQVENFGLKTNLNVADYVSQNYNSCYIFTHHLQHNMLKTSLEKTHLKRHFYNTKTSNSSSIGLCHDELYLDVLSKIPAHFPYTEIIIFSENETCFDYIAKHFRNQTNRKYNVIIYHLSMLKKNFIDDVIKTLLLYDRVFIFLCSKEMLDLILLNAEQRKLSLPNNVWVINNGASAKKHALPYYTVLINHITYEGYEPKGVTVVNGFGEMKNCLLFDINERRDGVINVTLWHGSHYKDLFESRFDENGEITQLMFENDFQLQNVNNKLKPLKLLSISDGPFLAEAPYLYNEASKNCESSALLCRKFDTNTTSWKHSCCYGYVADLYTALGKLLHFYVDLYTIPGMKYGSFDIKTQTWNGMIGAVLRREFDMATPLTINTERMQVVDFSGPVIRVEMGIATKKKNIEYALFNLRVVGHLKITGIIAALGFFVISIILIYFYDNSVLLQKIQVDLLKRKRKVLQGYSFEDSFSYVAGIMFQRDIGGKNPATFAGRGVAIFFAFGMVALITLYTASLTVDQVTKVTNTQFKGLYDPKILNPTDEFPFGTIQDTSIEDFFSRSPDPKFQKVYKFMKKYNEPTIGKAVEKLLNGQLGAFLDDRPFLIKEIAKGAECKIEIHPNEVGTISYGIALQFNSSWTLPVSEAILKLKDEGFLEKLEKKWLSLKCPTYEQGEFQTFDLTFFATPTAFLMASAVISFVILLMECWWKRNIVSKRHTYDFQQKNKVQTEN